MDKEKCFFLYSTMTRAEALFTVILLVLKNASLFLCPDIFVLPFIESCQWISYQPLMNKKQKTYSNSHISLTVAENAVININLMLLVFLMTISGLM